MDRPLRCRLGVGRSTADYVTEKDPERDPGEEDEYSWVTCNREVISQL